MRSHHHVVFKHIKIIGKSLRLFSDLSIPPETTGSTGQTFLGNGGVNIVDFPSCTTKTELNKEDL